MNLTVVLLEIKFSFLEMRCIFVMVRELDYMHNFDLFEDFFLRCFLVTTQILLFLFVKEIFLLNQKYISFFMSAHS